ncbi:hypothetical protein Esi_0033_0119 [Ectocarpus siliculosus]|uniref:Uncharacterized protein n=1 Tax=Ectocarpus siliculosus TaxID=2880 RepID=D7FXM8_ECTSI|nr:hypothetical protein Esi_0033_0119 [Ectocarpus siliculosus]|eukprot:CBJ26469.1 hypothetical protein Esi_0033_0119 [Ectocarpus siliculosus]
MDPASALAGCKSQASGSDTGHPSDDPIRVSRDSVESAQHTMTTSTSINMRDERTENTPLGIWALLKFATLLSVTACFLLRVVLKAADSVVMLITGPPDVVPRPTPPPPSPPSPPPQVPH